MNFKQKMMTVLQFLGLAQKAQSNSLTGEDWQRIVNQYRLVYNANLRDDMEADAAPQAQTQTQTQTAQAATPQAPQAPQASQASQAPQAPQASQMSQAPQAPQMSQSPQAPQAPQAPQMSQAPQAPQAPQEPQQDLNALQNALADMLNRHGNSAADATQIATTDMPASPRRIDSLAQNLDSLLQNLRAAAVPDRPAAMVAGGVLPLAGSGTTPLFLFGIEHPLFSMSCRWNRIAASPGYALTASITDDDSREFFAGVGNFSASLQRRFAFLHANNMLNADRLAAGEFSSNYAGVRDAKVGDQFVIRRQDALIAHVLKKRDLTQFFPVRYGIQDHDLVFNAFFDTVSQGYQPGRIFKGGMKIEHEMGHVDDAMIKLQFGPMKEIERMYIGYLNKEGSDPVKWSMIEFAVLNSLETAQVEQNKRRVRGIYVKPETGVAGHFLHASTGILYTLIRYAKEYKFLLHDDAAYRSYSKATMLDAVKEFLSDVIASCTEDMDIDNHVLYLNAMHRSWWIEAIRAAYGKETDFSGPGSYADVVPDTNTRIVWLPYLGQIPIMLMDIPGNIQFLEFIPGEMLSLKVKEDMEEVIAWSTWKEGTAAAFVGRRFSSRQALVDNNFEFQQIFMNKFAASLAPDATAVDAHNGFWHESVANTGATTITDIVNAKEGVAYLIECGSLTYASKIAKSGNFSEISAAWTPSAVGDYIMLVKLSTGKFAELERTVGGTRTVNAALQPNLPGVR